MENKNYSREERIAMFQEIFSWQYEVRPGIIAWRAGTPQRVKENHKILIGGKA